MDGVRGRKSGEGEARRVEGEEDEVVEACVAMLDTESAVTPIPRSTAITECLPASRTSGSMSLRMIMKRPNPIVRNMGMVARLDSKSYGCPDDESGVLSSILSAFMPSVLYNDLPASKVSIPHQQAALIDL